MGRPYNRKTKKDAIAICEVLASNPDIDTAKEATIALGIKPSSTGVALAAAACNAVCDAHLAYGRFDNTVEERCAEAAQLIREGWKIGDSAAVLGPSATVEAADAILKETFPDTMIGALASQPSPSFANLGLAPELFDWPLVEPVVGDTVQSDVLVGTVSDDEDNFLAGMSMTPPTEADSKAAAEADSIAYQGDYGADS